MTSGFVHLNVRTTYSIVDGIGTPADYVAMSKEDHQDALAINDFMNQFSTLKFFKSAIGSSIKPILGAQLAILEDDRSYEMTWLCINRTGYENLSRLITKSYFHEGLRQYAYVLKSELTPETTEGLIALSGGLQGELAAYVEPLSSKDSLNNKVQFWKDLLPGRFYLELQRIGHADEERYNHTMLELALVHQLPVVATNAVRFLNADDVEAHTARVCINQGKPLEVGLSEQAYTNQQYFKTQEQMIDLFKDVPQAVENTVEISRRCSVALMGDGYAFPVYQGPKDTDLFDHIKDLCKKGMQKKLSALTDDQSQVYQERLDEELGIINRMGFVGYFLIVSDFVRWAKENQVPVGPGRGSGGGSLVAYCLEIIDIDPIHHGLLFERFLNPERVSMPDFDIDFCMDKRDQVIDYVVRHYGKNHVAQIITYGTMAAKAVVRDVGRILGMSHGFVDKLAKMVPFELGMTLAKALEQNPDLSDLYHTDTEVQTLIDLGLKLEGNIRNVSKHAGGVVISPKPLVHYMPLYQEHEHHGHPVTQFDKDDVEEIGLVKFDFLGLRTLTIIDWTLSHIRQRNPDIDLDIYSIPLDDKRVFKHLHKDTAAVFQLESRGFSDLVKRLKPDCFEDIVALVALYRPGPLQSGMVDDFIDRKHGRSDINYFHADLKPILETTYGVILYQEQVMKIAQVMAGYSLGEADILRRAMGKKKFEEMKRQGKIFVERATQKGYDEHFAREIFDLMEKFAGYGFNKSHSVAYALITYQTACLKTYYAPEFMASVLSSDMDNTDKLVQMIRCCHRLDLTLRKPCIQEGSYHFSVNDSGEIIYGLGAIKGLGEPMCHAIAKASQDQPFHDLVDVCQRLQGAKINRKTLEALIVSGAVDMFGLKRVDAFLSIEKLIHHSQKLTEDKQRGQVDLFSDLSTSSKMSQFEYITSGFWSPREILKREKDVLGYYLSGHPLKTYQAEVKYLPHLAINRLDQQKGVTICGYVEHLKVSFTKAGRRFSFLTVEDTTGTIDVAIYSDLYEEIRETLAADTVVVVVGDVKADQYSGGKRLVAKSCVTIQDYRAEKSPTLLLNWSIGEASIVESLKGVLRQSPGRSKVMMRVIDDGRRVLLGLPKWSVMITDELIERLQRLEALESYAIHYKGK